MFAFIGNVPARRLRPLNLALASCYLGRGPGPSERAVERAAVEQMPQPAEAREAVICEFAMCQTDAFKRGVQMSSALPRRPSEVERRESPFEFRKIGFVGSLIGARLQYDPKLAARDGLADDLPEFADLVIEFVCARIEGLVVDELQRRLKHRLERARRILNVNHRSPGCSVAVDQDSACRTGTAHQIVENGVEAHAWRESVDSPIATESWREVVVGEPAQG